MTRTKSAHIPCKLLRSAAQAVSVSSAHHQVICENFDYDGFGINFFCKSIPPKPAGLPGMSPALVIEKVEQKSVFVTKLEEEPQLGGQGSGFPPRFLVATGSLGHAIIGIDLGSHWARVASVIHNEPQLLAAPVSALVTLGNRDSALAPNFSIEPTFSLLNLIGTDCDLKLSTSDYAVYSVEQILELFLNQLIEHSQKGAAHLIKKCVLTVPASFTCERRRVLREIVENSGLEVLNLINESTAAALAYVHSDPFIEGNVLMFGMGANHFATSLIESRNGILETRSTSADSNLGGEDFDNLLIEWFFSEFEKKFKMPLPRVPVNISSFKIAAERAKMDLTMSTKTYVRFTSLEVPRNPLDFEEYDLFLEIERDQFAKMAQPLIDKAMRHVSNVLDESRLNSTDVDFIIPIGSASQMPVLMDALKNVFPAGPRWKTSNMPCASAKGAALHASILTRTLRDFVVWDVLAVPICVELPDGKCKVVVSSGTPLPITGYYQIESSDATVNLHIMQGYSDRTEGNCSIAEVTVNNCPPTSSADTKVEIAVIVRADGIVDFSARHVELQVNLPLTIRRGQPTTYTQRPFQMAPDVAPKRACDPQRLARLCRKLNMSEADTVATLKTLRYPQLEIDDGTAVETLIRSLRKTTKKRSS